jgi:hypothetical protein
MTWVIGMSRGPIGGGFIASDVRITVGTTYYEAVQKVHPLAWCVLGGFSGSVLLGFDAVQMAQRRWKDSLKERRLVAPSEVARHLGRDLRDAWEQEKGNFDAEHKRGGLSLLIVGVNPSPRPAAHPEVMPWHPSDAFILRAPPFEPCKVPRGEPRSIGSGSSIPEYEDAICKWLADPGASSMFPELAMALLAVRDSAHEARSEETISESLQIIRLDPEGEGLGDYLGPDHSVRIARNAQEFRDLAQDEGFTAADAVASRGDLRPTAPERLGRFPRPGPSSSYASASRPTSRAFGHGPKWPALRGRRSSSPGRERLPESRADEARRAHWRASSFTTCFRLSVRYEYLLSGRGRPRRH